VGRGNVRANGHPGSDPWRQLQCVVCQTYFLETQGTPFHGKRVPATLLVRVVTAVAEGLGIRAAVEPCSPFFKIDLILCERGPHCICANLAGFMLVRGKLSVTQVKPTI
jgi:hypothetical protein